jgi:hypothetical protein
MFILWLHVVHVQNGVETIAVDTHRFHIGRSLNHPGSIARVHFRHDGSVDAQVHLADGKKFHIEPAGRYPELLRSGNDTSSGSGGGFDRKVEGGSVYGGSDNHTNIPDHDRNRNRNHVVFKASHLNDEAVRSVGRHCGVDGNDPSLQKGDQHQHHQHHGTSKYGAFAQDVALPEFMRGRRSAANDAKDSSQNQNKNGNSVGSQAASDCRAMQGSCSCAVSLYADHFFLASEFGEGDPNIAAQYMVNQLASADGNFRQTKLNGISGW